MLDAEAIYHKRAPVAAQILQSACEVWHKRQMKEAPSPGSTETLLSHHQSDQQWFQLSHSPTTASVSEGLLRVLKAFESKGMTLMFDAVGKDKPKLCTTLCCTPANSSFHSDVCLLGPGLEYLHGISPPGPEPIAVPAKQCITSHKHALL